MADEKKIFNIDQKASDKKPESKKVEKKEESEKKPSVTKTIAKNGRNVIITEEFKKKIEAIRKRKAEKLKNKKVK